MPTGRRSRAATDPIGRSPCSSCSIPDLGLGPPGDHSGNGASQPPAARRERLLRDLALEAQRSRRLVVELDDGCSARLETWPPEAATGPSSLDVSVFVAASSPAAIDAGEFQAVVGPNLGADCGRT